MRFPGFCLTMCLIICLQAQILRCQNKACHPNDLKALSGFTDYLQSPIDGWSNLASPDCCTWTGVTCDNATVPAKRVIGLQLDRKRLTGRISASISGLDHLRTLNLSQNRLSGFLPIELFRLRNLELLDLSNNEFQGPINGRICEFITGIRELDFSNNYFSGELPATLGNCTSLQLLSFHGNNLFGTLPDSIFQLTNIRDLQLQENWFSGPLNTEIRNLSNLVKLDISLNLFSGVLPDVFGSLEKLEHFLAASNNFTGGLPASLTNSSSLVTLDVRNNSLNGLINLNCSAMINLVTVDLGSNFFHGPVPDCLSTCARLANVNLARINFSSEIPTGFKNLQALTHISLSEAGIRNLSAALGILQHCHNLSTLVLTGNFQEEELLPNVNFEFKNLKAFILANCQLKGSIPQWLRSCVKLQLLDMSWNSLSGTIPSWFGQFEDLFYLDLSNNSFIGEIPKTLTELRRLQSSIAAPKEPFPSFPLYHYKKQGPTQLSYNQIWSFPPTLNLGINKLIGSIWPDFGNLKALHILDLRENVLSGSIPDNLSGMTSLEILDLSCNNLSGEIPMSFDRLTFLSKFNASYNQLSGRVPTGGQFMTFPNSSFEGNKGLCGGYISPCGSKESSPVQSTSTEGMKIVGLQFTIGAAVGFIITVTICFLSGWVFPKGAKKRKQVTRIYRFSYLS